MPLLNQTKQKILATLLIFGSASLVSNTAFAQVEPNAESKFEEQQSLPIVVDAKRQSVDIEKNTLSFYEDVEIKQGNMHIKADQLDIIRDKKTEKETLIATGKPAWFSHVLDDDIKIEAQADKMTYIVSKHLLTLEGSAQIAQNDSKIIGEKIEYNVKLRQLQASSNSENNSRVRAVLTPKKD